MDSKERLAEIGKLRKKRYHRTKLLADLLIEPVWNRNNGY